MALLSEPEEIRRLRHRWARLTEIWAAYTTFLHREVEVGPDKVCLNNEIVTQTTHTLLIVYYSYMYSLFDPTGTDFESITRSIEHVLPESAVQVRDKILQLWHELNTPLQAIRHNVGFHGAKADKRHKYGLKKLEEFHPLLPQALCAYLRVFFRFLQQAYVGSRPLTPTKRPEIGPLLEYAKDLETEARKPLTEVPANKLLRLGITREAYGAFLRTIEENKPRRTRVD